MINTTVLNERSKKIVAALVAQLNKTTVTRAEIISVYEQIVQKVDGSPGAERLAYAPNFISQNIACKTKTRGTYDLSVFLPKPEPSKPARALSMTPNALRKRAARLAAKEAAANA